MLFVNQRLHISGAVSFGLDAILAVLDPRHSAIPYNTDTCKLTGFSSPHLILLFLHARWFLVTDCVQSVV
jgi:hypothetical protein